MKKYKVVVALLWGFALIGCKISKPLPDDPQFVSPKQFSAQDTLREVVLPKDLLTRDTLLVRLIDSTLERNLDLQLLNQQVARMAAQMRLVRGIDRPDLMAGLTQGQRRFGKYTMDGVGNFDTNFSPNLTPDQKVPHPHLPDYLIGVQSSWEIDVWGKLKSTKKAALHRWFASQAGQRLFKTQLVAEVASLYYQLVLLREEQTMLRENILLQERALDLVRVMKQAGEANELGVELLAAQLLSSQATLTNVQQIINETQLTLNGLAGRFPQEILTNGMPPESLEGVQWSVGTPASLLRNRPDIVQAEEELRASKADVDAARLAFLPAVNISANLGFQAFRAALWFNPASIAYQLVGGVAAPLLNRRVLESQLLMSRADQQAAYIRYKQVILTSFQEVNQFQSRALNLQEQVQLKKQEVELLRRSISTSTDLFLSGRATYLEVITAQKNALQAQIELIDLQRNWATALAQLYRSLGGGW